MKTSARPAAGSAFLRRTILSGTLLPASLATSASRATTTLVPTPPQVSVLDLDSNAATPLFAEGLREGFVNGADNETTANPLNGPDNGQGQGVSLGLRMAQATFFNPANGWANPRTWIYTGEVF